jgi:hypothetical protein
MKSVLNLKFLPITKRKAAVIGMSLLVLGLAATFTAVAIHKQGDTVAYQPSNSSQESDTATPKEENNAKVAGASTNESDDQAQPKATASEDSAMTSTPAPESEQPAPKKDSGKVNYPVVRPQDLPKVNTPKPTAVPVRVTSISVTGGAAQCSSGTAFLKYAYTIKLNENNNQSGNFVAQWEYAPIASSVPWNDVYVEFPIANSIIQYSDDSGLWGLHLKPYSYRARLHVLKPNSAYSNWITVPVKSISC